MFRLRGMAEVPVKGQGNLAKRRVGEGGGLRGRMGLPAMQSLQGTKIRISSNDLARL